VIKIIKHIWERRVIYYIVFFMIACPLTMVLGAFTPENLSFLEPVVCPPGMHFDQMTETQTDLDGTVVALRAMCTDGEERVERTGMLSLFVCGTPVLVGILLVLPAFLPSGKDQDEDQVEAADTKE
jgi:hypothetical protein